MGYGHFYMSVVFVSLYGLMMSSSMCAVSDSDIDFHSMVFVFDGSEMDQLNRSQFHPVCQ